MKNRAFKKRPFFHIEVFIKKGIHELLKTKVIPEPEKNILTYTFYYANPRI